MKHVLLAAGVALSASLAAPAFASGPLNILTVGPNYGGQATANFVPSSASPVGGVDHIGSTVTHVAPTSFNTLSAGDLAVYDVVLVQWASPAALDLSSMAVQDYVGGGGGLILDGASGNFADLVWAGFGSITSCTGFGSSWVLDGSAVADGFLLDDSLPSDPHLDNCHGGFVGYGPNFMPFLWDLNGTAAGIAGTWGSGRIIITGPDHDYHVFNVAADPEQFQLLLNQLEWVTRTDPCEDPSTATIIGTAGDDYLLGTPGDDIIFGLGGDDYIDGKGGNDILCGGAGKDAIAGGPGNDMIDGGAGYNWLFGNVGDDIIYGGDDGNELQGGAGEDSLEGGAGIDTIYGGPGNDILTGGAGDDDMLGNDGDDQLFGDDGEDWMNGGEGNDCLDGGADDDMLNGDGGDDCLDGGAGVDQANCGAGNDSYSDGEWGFGSCEAAGPCSNGVCQ